MYTPKEMEPMHKRHLDSQGSAAALRTSSRHESAAAHPSVDKGINKVVWSMVGEGDYKIRAVFPGLP